jgi:hypothetical protein
MGHGEARPLEVVQQHPVLPERVQGGPGAELGYWLWAIRKTLRTSGVRRPPWLARLVCYRPGSGSLRFKPPPRHTCDYCTIERACLPWRCDLGGGFKSP